MLDSLFQDIRYGARGLVKRPGFTAIALIILALGIGANTAIFTLINAVVLKQLPVTQPGELVLFSDIAGEGTRISDGDLGPGKWDLFLPPSYRYFREHNRSFQELSAFRSGESRLSVRRSDAPRVKLRKGLRATWFRETTLRCSELIAMKGRTADQ